MIDDGEGDYKLEGSEEDASRAGTSGITLPTMLYRFLITHTFSAQHFIETKKKKIGRAHV